MAWNSTVFKTRALTALVFVAVMLLGLLVHCYLYVLLIAIIHFGAWWEYSTIANNITNSKPHPLLGIGFMVSGASFLCWATTHIYVVERLSLVQNFGLFFAVSGFLLIVLGIFKTKVIKVNTITFYLLGLPYITLSCSFLIQLASTTYYTNTLVNSWLPYGILLPAFVITCMWINDTMAYIVGSLIGRTPLSSISPKKTWEGTIGGIVLCACIVGISMYYISVTYLPCIALWQWITLALVASVLGTIGDLVESKLKRMANLKDSGSFMPGHGGFLDRFDSLLFATPFMWLLFYIIIRQGGC